MTSLLYILIGLFLSFVGAWAVFGFGWACLLSGGLSLVAGVTRLFFP